MPDSIPHHHPHITDLAAIDRFDAIIDVRSPAEFADDHIPGAISAPVLTNEERAMVGTMYVQESAFKATRLGAALVARHIATHLETLFADKPRDWRPLVYCWRGGKRSGAMAEWFHLIGWKACKLQGGYKVWRRHVMDSLDALPARYRFIVLAGPTGSGKTRLLHALGRQGAQTLDLEGIAHHRGSLLGAMPNDAQPSQRGFESGLYTALNALDPHKPVFVEAESRRIGRCDLTNAFVHAIRESPCVYVKANMPDRIAFLREDYAHLFDDRDAFKACLSPLVGLHSRETVRRWQAWIDADRRGELFESLVESHYDPAYRRSSRKDFVRLAGAQSFTFNPAPGADADAQARTLLAQLKDA